MIEFSIGDCIRFGLETFKKRPWFFIGVICLIGLVQLGLQILGYIPVLGSIAAIVGGVYVGMGMIHFMLRAHDAVKEVSLNDIWTPHPFWKYVGAVALKGLIVSGPLIIVVGAWMIGAWPRMQPDVQFYFTSSDVYFVIVGALAFIWLIYMSIRLMFAEYAVIDKKKGPIEAVKESFRISQGSWWKIFLFGLTLAGINILGALALLVGLLVSIPVSSLALVHAYRVLSKSENSTV